ncbi:hypothetical protein EN12_21170 [Vibrio cholerae]|uniref:Trypsin-like peptidase domain-containing protein n=1 Tax=Vibrio cholerae TaxID=666 RepID=A0A5B1C2D0_VIBCL|nr:trypsin-like peptidase domain-containing protein [Vibrio cholerae]AKO77638.1 hypothetical protein EN12_21170 [Vibrio cholerae]KAA1253644.1 trypsin-like peptidase domain-containing protein [Vibrio cholerae]HDV5593910.1 trypsin-like peptidase domain-containing protein [Vibrio cholerae]
MKIKKKLRSIINTIPIISCSILAGCAGNGLVTPTTEMDNVDLKFLGFPGVLAMQGSAVRIDENWLLTAKHNAFFIVFDDVYEHPFCDIALIKDKGEIDAPANFKLANENEKVTHKGYGSFLAIPSKSNGEFLQYLTVNNCTLGLSNAPVWSGMSGGAVYNSNQELIGINQSIIWSVELSQGSIPLKEAERRTSFTPVCTDEVAQWIENVTGVQYCVN